MAANVSGEYRTFKYYEGTCSSSDFSKEIAKVLSLGVRSKEIKDIDGKVLQEPFVLRSKNWDIVYPAPDASMNLNLDNMTTEEYVQKILNQVGKISDTVILKTTTTPKEIAENTDDLTIDDDTNKASLTMYLEIYHPTYIADPEQYPLDCERRGIIPRLVTKEMIRDSMKTTIAKEEQIYGKNVGSRGESILPSKREDTIVGSVEFSYEKCDEYVAKINNIYGNVSFSTPTVDGSSTSVDIDSVYLAKIKQNDIELYTFITNTLNNGEGIEAKDYTKLESMKFEIMKEGSSYVIVLEGKKILTTYMIPSGFIKVVEHDPLEKLIPELYMDGIYIPIDTNLYTVDGKQIKFLDNFTFEASEQGLLVIRYTYAVSSTSTITDRKTFLNNHYVLMRLFDRLNKNGNGPAENAYNANGEIIQMNSHISPWSKLSWYQDFEELMVDNLDADIPTNNIHDGTVWVPLETAGLNSDTKVRYWINTNNDRFSIIVMGNPAMDYMRDRHLISACYCGRIDSFDHSINDTAGNFALFTSSSTEPCNTTLTAQQITYPMENYYLSDDDILNNTYDTTEFENFLKECPWHTQCTGKTDYYIQLNGKNYFDRTKWPKCIIVDANGRPVTALQAVYKRNFVVEEGKSDLLQITLDPEMAAYDENYTIYVSYAYYQEQYLITSGVSRDAFGNVIDVDKVKDYGNNTSDGVTSIMMFHTRAKAYYQKHHMLFATTEEYMSKVMYGKSSYTGEYYADRIKVTHGNDGPRGTLSDLLVIDSSSLFAMDELVINKDFEKDPEQYEETFVYFPITAPYSPLSDSPNSRYGLAIKKEEVEPTYADEKKILDIAMDEIGVVAGSWWPVDKNIFPMELTTNGCSVYWKVLEDTAWINNEKTRSTYVPVRLALTNTSQYWGDLDNPLQPEAAITIDQGDTVADLTTSYIKISGFVPSEGEIVMYGISDTMIDSFGADAQIRAVLTDGALDEPESFEYSIEGVPYKGDIGTAVPTSDVSIMDATPDKYLMLYSVNTDDGKYTIKKFVCIPLKNEAHDKNWLLQYPCKVNVLTVSGMGKYVSNGKLENFINTNVEYGSDLTIPIVPGDVYEIEEVQILDAETEEVEKTITTFQDVEVNNLTYRGIVVEDITKDIKIKGKFKRIIPLDSPATGTSE